MSFRQITAVELPADYSSLETARTSLESVLAHLPGLPQSESSLYNLQLALHEILTNIIQHAYQGSPTGRIRLIFSVDEIDRQLMIETHDWGRPFDLAATPTPDLDHPQEHGYGLFLIHALMDQVTYLPQDDGNTWRLVKNLA